MIFRSVHFKLTWIYSKHGSIPGSDFHLFLITETGKLLQIVHNFGHGGAGVTCAYGCAIEVANIVDMIINNGNKPTSKL